MTRDRHQNSLGGGTAGAETATSKNQPTKADTHENSDKQYGRILTLISEGEVTNQEVEPGVQATVEVLSPIIEIGPSSQGVHTTRHQKAERDPSSEMTTAAGHHAIKIITSHHAIGNVAGHHAIEVVTDHQAIGNVADHHQSRL